MLSIFRYIQGLVALRGGTDGTVIGNESDRLKVSGQFEESKISNKFKVDYSTNNIGVGFGYTNLYLYLGTGTFYAFSLRFSTDNVFVRLFVDTNIVMDLDMDDSKDLMITGSGYRPICNSIDIVGENINFYLDKGIDFSTGVLIQARAKSGSPVLYDRMVTITQET